MSSDGTAFSMSPVLEKEKTPSGSHWDRHLSVTLFQPRCLSPRLSVIVQTRTGRAGDHLLTEDGKCIFIKGLPISEADLNCISLIQTQQIQTAIFYFYKTFHLYLYLQFFPKSLHHCCNGKNNDSICLIHRELTLSVAATNRCSKHDTIQNHLLSLQHQNSYARTSNALVSH